MCAFFKRSFNILVNIVSCLERLLLQMGKHNKGFYNK